MYFWGSKYIYISKGILKVNKYGTVLQNSIGQTIALTGISHYKTKH